MKIQCQPEPILFRQDVYKRQDDYDRVIWDGVARTAEMTYNSISEDYGNGGNYISSLKPGAVSYTHLSY